MSVLIALWMLRVLRGVGSEPGKARRTSPLQALRVPRVAPLPVLIFAYMTAFYGSFAFFGEGVRHAFVLSAQATSMFVLAYGLGFGAAGVGVGIAAPQIQRRYTMAVLLGIGASYFGCALCLGDTRRRRSPPPCFGERSTSLG